MLWAALTVLGIIVLAGYVALLWAGVLLRAALFPLAED
jgi:hypothetical protein